MIKISAPKSHPRFLSLYYRDLLAEGVRIGITSLQGLTAHGRGETFDYKKKKKTLLFAKSSIKATAALLLLARYPVLSVNGNTAILVPKEFIKLSNLVGAQIEVNIFHASKERERKIKAHLEKFGAGRVLLPGKARISGIESNRWMISSIGQKKADVVFVPLEDGDRTQALTAMGKKVITVDLNPLSRTAQTATITIVDNIVRVMPLLIKKADDLKNSPPEKLLQIVERYDNKKILSEALNFINRRLHILARR
ncbi:phosphopantothenate/pantothenate synthetase [Candidatus Gottesmanbacteria bacterium]|nr:phosphopantothenate/pantothenate synthetase [Candidatus Gottesmanbacteria bacterium]